MKSPFDIDESAFQPFYDQVISISGQSQKTSLKACVFEEIFDDPLSEMSPSADRRKILVFIPMHGEGGWNDETSPKLGDILTVTSWGGMAGTDEFAIEFVQEFSGCWRLTAREVSR